MLLIHTPNDNGACCNFRLSLEVSQLYYRLQCGQVALCSGFQNQTQFIVPHLYVYLRSSRNEFEPLFFFLNEEICSYYDTVIVISPLLFYR